MESNKNQEKKTTFDFSVFSEKQTAEDVEWRLARLVSTYKTKFVPLTARQRELAALSAPPYEGLAPDKAIIEFNTLLKSIPVSTVSSYFPTIIRQKPVTIGLSTITVSGQEIVPIGGSLDKVSGIEVFAREAANILTVYTSHDGVYVSDKVDQQMAVAVRMPSFSLKNIRRLVNVPGGDNSKTRDEIYNKLKKQNPEARSILLFTIHSIYSNPIFFEMRKHDPDLTNYYMRHKLPGMPDIAELYVPCPSNFTAPSITSSVACWRLACKSVALRGGRKHRGALSVGYYRYDMPSADVELCDEMTDVYNLCQTYKYKAVRLMYPNVSLARYLVFNKITVYCPALSGEVQLGDKLGLFSRGKQKCMIWEARVQNMPTLSTNSVTMPEPGCVSEGQSYIYEYIPEIEEPGATYLPSIKAAEGLCIKTFVKGAKGVSLNKLRARFSMAVYYRNWYIFTRLPFVSQDVFRDRFDKSWVCPPVVDMTMEDLFAGAIMNSVEIDEKDYRSRLYSEMIAAPLEEPVIEINWGALFKNYVKDLDPAYLAIYLEEKTLDAKPPYVGTDEFYTNMNLEEYLRIIGEFVSEAIPVSEQPLRANEMDPALSLQEEDDDAEDIFANATRRVAQLRSENG